MALFSSLHCKFSSISKLTVEYAMEYEFDCTKSKWPWIQQNALEVYRNGNRKQMKWCEEFVFCTRFIYHTLYIFHSMLQGKYLFVGLGTACLPEDIL